MTKEEIHKLSTPEERMSQARYEALQYEAANNGCMMGETALLEASQAVGVLVVRNKRLGLIKK